MHDDNGHRLHRFDFKIRKENAEWYIGPHPGYAPAYFGSVWVDPAHGSIHRLDMEANSLPEYLAIMAASLRVRFSLVEISGVSYQMPSTGEVTVCTRWAFCERRKITFANYHLSQQPHNWSRKFQAGLYCANLFNQFSLCGLGLKLARQFAELGC